MCDGLNRVSVSKNRTREILVTTVMFDPLDHPFQGLNRPFLIISFGDQSRGEMGIEMIYLLGYRSTVATMALFGLYQDTPHFSLDY